MAASLEALDQVLAGMEKIFVDGVRPEEAGSYNAGTGFTRLA